MKRPLTALRAAPLQMTVRTNLWDSRVNLHDDRLEADRAPLAVIGQPSVSSPPQAFTSHRGAFIIILTPGE